MCMQKGVELAACLLKLSKSTLCLSFDFWIQFFSQPVGKKIDAHNQENQSGAGKDDHPPHADVDIILSDGNHHTQRRFGQRHAESTALTMPSKVLK